MVTAGHSRRELEAQLRESQHEAEQQPRKLQEKMEKVVLEGNNAREALHKCTTECTRIFHEVSDWMGIIARRNQTLEDVHTRIQSLNEEVAVTMDPLEQQEKFDQIQQVDNELNALFEAQSVAKKELHEFRPVVQTTYMQMHQVDATVDSEWNSLVASKPKGCITDATQQFIVEASLLARKWQDKIVGFQEVRKRALELVPELGPSFEEAEKERAQAEDERKVETEDKGKQQALLEATKEPRT
jgi:cysteinyl-tRNA synthetase